MPVLKLIRGVAVVLATLGIVVPISSIQAAEASQRASRTSTASIAADVSQSSKGLFAGRVVDHTGAVVQNADVVIRQGTTEVARCQTDKEGMFSAKNLKPGTYLVSSGATEGCFRIWSEKTAPPAARKNALIVLGNDGARGQYANCDECPPGGWNGFHSIDPTICLLTAGVVTAIVLSAVSLSKANSLNSNVNSLQTKVNDLEARVTYLESKIPSSP